MKHRLITIFLTMSMLLCVFAFSAPFSWADDTITYEAEYVPESPGNLTLPSGVTRDMCKASYWKKITLGDADKVLMTHSEIDSWNKAVEDASGTGTSDLTTYGTTTKAAAKREALMSSNPFAYRTDKTSVYINGKTYNKNEYIENEVLKAIEASAYTEESRPYQYAVAVRRTAIKALPIPYEMGWSASDPDDEN